MKSRFVLFDDSEREVIRMALRRLYDDYLKAEMQGYEPSENSGVAAALIYELTKGL